MLGAGDPKTTDELQAARVWHLSYQALPDGDYLYTVVRAHHFIEKFDRIDVEADSVVVAIRPSRGTRSIGTMIVRSSLRMTLLEARIRHSPPSLMDHIVFMIHQFSLWFF